MATTVGTVYLNGCNYQLQYDLLSQSVEENKSRVRLYGVLNVTNNYIAWSSGSASVHTSGLQGIGTYYSRGTYTLIQRDFDFTHNSDGTFSIYIGASLSTTFVSGDTGGVVTLPTIPRRSIINSFTNSGGLTGTFNVTYTSYSSSFTNKLRISIPHVIALQTIDYVSGTNFTLSNEVLQTIYNNTTNTKTFDLGAVIETWNGNTKIGENGEPTISFTISEPPTLVLNTPLQSTDTITTNLCGSNNYYINYISQGLIKVTATPLHSATLAELKLTSGNNSYNLTSGVNYTLNNAVLSSNNYNIVAKDSRSNSSSTTNTINVVQYIPLTLNASVSRHTQVDGLIDLVLSGNVYNGDFNTTANTLRYKITVLDDNDTEQDVSSGTISMTNNRNTYNTTFSNLVNPLRLDGLWYYTNIYTLYVYVWDSISGTNYTSDYGIKTSLIVKKGIPEFAIFQDALFMNGIKLEGILPTLLWTNPSPSYPFASQTLNIDTSDYAYLKILYVINGYSGEQPVSSERLNCHTIYKDSVYEYSDITESIPVRSSNTYIIIERIIRVTDSTIEIGDGTAFYTNNTMTYNYGCIPYKIIGYK